MRDLIGLNSVAKFHSLKSRVNQSRVCSDFGAQFQPQQPGPSFNFYDLYQEIKFVFHNFGSISKHKTKWLKFTNLVSRRALPTVYTGSSVRFFQRGNLFGDAYIKKRPIEASKNKRLGQRLEVILSKESTFEEFRVIVNRLVPGFLELAKDPTGCWVLSAVYKTARVHRQTIKNLRIGGFRRAAIDNAMELCHDRFGQRVMKSFVHNATDKERELLFNEFMHPTELNLVFYKKLAAEKGFTDLPENPLNLFYLLAIDQYASFFLQKFNNFISVEATDKILEFLLLRTVQLSMEQFGSVFLTGLLAPHDKEMRVSITKALLYPSEEDLAFLRGVIDDANDATNDIKPLDIMKIIAQDQYGNYVIKEILKNCSPEELNNICKAVVPNFSELPASHLGSMLVQKFLLSSSEKGLKDLMIELRFRSRRWVM